MRLDAYLVANGYARSRQSAKRAIEAGAVCVNGVVARKSSQTVEGPCRIEYSGIEDQFVSRGALKLQRALDAFAINPAGLICLDLGASTGGFTQVLLRQKAAKVYAVDVGTDQLADEIRDDPRVFDLSQTHAQKLTRAMIPEQIDLLVCDVSFISLKKALPPALALCKNPAKAVVLIKPQFEVGRAHIGKNGIVSFTPAESRAWVEAHILPWFGDVGWSVRGLIDSPIKGGDGNGEFLAWIERRSRTEQSGGD